jgi:6-phosphofructokinase 1
MGGSYLGSSCEGFDLEGVLNILKKMNFNQLYIIGHKIVFDAFTLMQEIERQKLKIGVSFIPSSIENDIPIIDQCFGQQTCI